MRASIKQLKGKHQTSRSKPHKQMKGQESQDLELKIQKMQKQIALLNMDIESLLQERKFKDGTQRALVRERNKLESSFLYRDFQASKQIKQSHDSGLMQGESKSCQQAKHRQVKNHFRDVNQTIVRYIKQLQSQKADQPITENLPNQSEPQAQTSQSKTPKLQCQSLHLKQIFNPQQTFTHQTKSSKLQQKLSLLYQKIRLNLERQQPYLHEKILERIKRQAQSYTRKKLLQEIDKLIKQNSVWMTQQTNRVNNQLEEQKVEQICVNNLGMMKKIMAKKVANNDWIFENYSADSGFTKGSALGFPLEKISKHYQDVIKTVQEQRIAAQFAMVRKTNTKNCSKIQKESLKYLLSEKAIQNLLKNQQNQQTPSEQTERQLTSQAQHILSQIQKLLNQ